MDVDSSTVKIHRASAVAGNEDARLNTHVGLRATGRARGTLWSRMKRTVRFGWRDADKGAIAIGGLIATIAAGLSWLQWLT